MRTVENCNPCPICGGTTIKIMKMPREKTPLDAYCTVCGFYLFGDTEEELINKWNKLDADEMERKYQDWLKEKCNE